MSTFLKHCTAITLALCCHALCAACSKCGDRGMDESTPIGAPLKLENIELGVDMHRFRLAVADLAGIDSADAESRITCRSQSELTVIDPKEKAVIERPGGGHVMENCLLEETAAGAQAGLIFIRGEFIDSRLVKVTYRFAAGQSNSLATSLENRFSDGVEVDLEDRSIFEGRTKTYTLWQVENELWASYSGDQGAAIVERLDLSVCGALPPPSEKTAERGKPVSLEELGIGAMDLDAPLPEIPELDSPDSGPDSSP